MVSTIKSISVVTVFLFFSCEGMTPQWNDEISHRWAFLRAKQGQDGLIQLSSKNTGVTFQNDITRELIAANRALLNGSGVTTGDVVEQRVQMFSTGTWEAGSLKILPRKRVLPVKISFLQGRFFQI